MNPSMTAVALISEFEGLRLAAYIDAVGVPTIGYGTTRYPNGSKVRLGQKITADDAKRFLLHDMQRFAGYVTDLTEGAELNQNQFDALVSFVYNLGPGALEVSTLLKQLRAGRYADAAREFDRWVKGRVGGKLVVLPGLVRRRAAERKLFETPSEQTKPAPTVNPTIRVGAEGRWVEHLQELLNDKMDAGLKVDGDFGPVTARAVVTFQLDRGLIPDGIVGPSTWARLEE